ncbi:MAG: protein of unknown function with transrane region [Candidatus Adlerbacteria bacterium]|nr:protein of unknown function with transrane region [Candidatus Adlerbacteria bacterium]
MPPQQQPSSFIPKTSLNGANAPAVGSFSILMFIGVLFFVASLICAIGVFGYEHYLKSSIASKAATLQQDQEAFGKNAISDLVRLDTRINQAKSLLNKHIASSAIFNFLQEHTLATVQFTTLEYKLNNDGTASISLDGVGATFSSVALQSDQFGATKAFKDIIFSKINPDTTGRILFNVKAIILPDMITYAKNLEIAPSAAQTDASVQTQTTTQSTTATTTLPAGTTQ